MGRLRTMHEHLRWLQNCRTSESVSDIAAIKFAYHKTVFPPPAICTNMSNCDQRLRAWSNVRIARSQRNDLSSAFHLRKFSPSMNQEPVFGSRFSQTVLWVKEMSRMTLRLDEPSGSNSHRCILSRRSSVMMDIGLETTRHDKRHESRTVLDLKCETHIFHPD